MYRGRLAPSPTGAQHLGNARTHLIVFWAARQAGGELSLRIDDLDSPRVKDWASDQAIEDLRWLGIQWDRGPVYQSETLREYDDALQRLIDKELAYPCTCSRKDIEQALSAPHETRFRGEGIVYPGTCARWRKGDRLPEKDYCWRFRATDRQMTFDDLVIGTQRCNPAKELGDFPITQKNGMAAYQLAVTVDDKLAEVNSIVRGNDLVASTFRQIELHHALDWKIPTYAHVPLVCGLDGRRLAKRHGDTRLSFYRDQGVRPEQIIGWAAESLGMLESTEEATAEEFLEKFQFEGFPDEDTVIDTKRLFT